MDIFRGAERLMAMDDAAWRRHANPWSGYTRMVTVLPLLMLAIWSRVWLGWWALIPVGLALGWVWLNPRLFAEPKRFDSWMSKGVLGERIFIEHRASLPDHQLRMARILAFASAPGVVLMIWGLWSLWWEAAVFGALLGVIPKIWFVDRMVWIFHEWRAEGRPVPGMHDDEL